MINHPTPADPRAATYLAQLELALQPLPPQARADLIREIGSHLAERAAQGHLDEALTGLGAPYDFARSFVEDYDLTNALNRSTPLALLFSVLGRGARSLLALTTGFVALILYLCALGFAAIAMLKPITPNNVGMWRTPNGMDFGAIYGATHSQPELIGYWIIPICGISAAIAYLAATYVLRSSGRLMLRRAQRPVFA